jgi:hypothetical protein
MDGGNGGVNVTDGTVNGTVNDTVNIADTIK